MAGTKWTPQAIDSSGTSGGAVKIKNNDKNEVKDYLLGQLEETDVERIELRLLTDPAFGEEFDTIVDEITDEYVGNELQGEERKRFEEYFLRSTERQNKVRFASELLERAAVERGRPEPEPAHVHPGILESVRAFWVGQSFFARFASTFATIVIVVGVVLLAWPGTRPSGTYTMVDLTISASERATGNEIVRVRPEPGNAGIQIHLNLPDQIPPAKSFRVELIDQQKASRNLPIEQQTDRILLVRIPSDQITRGLYIIHLHVVTADGTEDRIRGSYQFLVE